MCQCIIAYGRPSICIKTVWKQLQGCSVAHLQVLHTCFVLLGIKIPLIFWAVSSLMIKIDSLPCRCEQRLYCVHKPCCFLPPAECPACTESCQRDCLCTSDFSESENAVSFAQNYARYIHMSMCGHPVVYSYITIGIPGAPGVEKRSFIVIPW